MPYTPAFQGQADSNYYSGLSQSTANMQNLYGYAANQFGGLYNNIANNPYNAQALAGAQATAQAGQTAGQQMLGMGQNFANWATQAYNEGQAGYNTAMGYIPKAMTDAQQLSSRALAYIPDALKQTGAIYDASMKNSQTAQSYIPAVMQTGFDPQSALYNYNYQQSVDAARASSAAAGLAGSPFAAGTASDAASKFNLDWLAGQQTRQGNAVNQLSSLIGDSNSSLGQALSASNSGVADLSTLLGDANTFNSSGIANLASLLGAANTSATSGMTNASTANTAFQNDTKQGLNTLAESSELPSQVYGEQQQKSMAALTALVTALTGINSAQGVNTGLWGQYLGLGQSSTQIADNATQINNSSSLMGGIGSLLGQLGQLGGMSTGGGGTLAGDLFFA